MNLPRAGKRNIKLYNKSQFIHLKLLKKMNVRENSCSLHKLILLPII